ncbi:MAG: pyruvate formate lyase family protein, partial [Clostridia bacterium]
SFILLWQVMCMEQAPNPFAFSVGNGDRIFEPYREKEGLSREYAAGLFKHFLVFFNVGDRSWAISQNVLIGGKGRNDEDLTNLCSYALLDAYFAMNLPQPILSVKLHKNTPDRLYEEMGKFLFTPGYLTPSFFNDDSIFEILKANGFDEADCPDYAVAGCQEPLIMGRDNGNTTNSWLNLPKILELTINNGNSSLSGEKLGLSYKELGAEENSGYVLRHIRQLFYKHLDYFLDRMAESANGATEAVSHLPVPFLSCFMGGIESGIDMRDVRRQGTKYNGSGCLIHGLTLVADSFAAIDDVLSERPEDAERLLEALRTDFEQDEELRQYLLTAEKFGNMQKRVDEEAAELALRVSELVRARKNNLGNPFRPDFSTPSTHLIYGNRVGAMPSGRKAKTMLSYGIDPLYGDAQQGLGLRVLSTRKLPFEQFNGGYASHLGLDPKYFRAPTLEEKGLEFKTKIIAPLFSKNSPTEIAPFYLYVNVTTAETLRRVLENPAKYAPSGVYIMRIHGTFVNFLDLSPEIQEDIILRLDLQSTSC